MSGSKRSHNEAGYMAKDRYCAYKLVKVAKISNSAVDLKCCSEYISDCTKGKFDSSSVQAEWAASLNKRSSLIICTANKLRSKITGQRTANEFDRRQDKLEVAAWDLFDEFEALEAKAKAKAKANGDE